MKSSSSAALPRFCARVGLRCRPLSQQRANPGRPRRYRRMPIESRPSRRPKAHPFAPMAGTWTGGGTIELTNDIKEKLRCRATYTYGHGEQRPCAGHPLRQRQLQVRADQQRRRAQRPDFRPMDRDRLRRLRLDRRPRQRRPHLGGLRAAQLHRGPVGEHQRHRAIGHHRAARPPTSSTCRSAWASSGDSRAVTLAGSTRDSAFKPPLEWSQV